MSTRGRVVRRERVVEYGSDDDGSYYEELPQPPPRRTASRLRVEVEGERQRSPLRRHRVHHANSYAAPQSAVDPHEIIIENTLNVPKYVRPRASSQGAAPHPNLLQPIYVQGPPREKSRERVKRYHHHYESDEYSSDDYSYTSSRRRRNSHRRSDAHSVEIAEQLARLRLLENQQKQAQLPPSVAEELARLRSLEDKRQRQEEEDSIMAKLTERKRREKEEEDRLLLEIQEKQRKRDAAEKAAIAEAEAKRLKREKELEEERERILSEEEARKKKEKEKHEALRKQILAEEEEKKRKQKQKEKEEEEEFNQKVKEKFMKAGYSPDYIEDILDEKKKSLVRRGSGRRAESQLAIDAARPTYIRVQVKHLYPQTLDDYGLPWEYDPQDRRFILIKEYITHELQQELFEHTKKIKIRQEKLLITDGYTKDTVTTTTLKPRDKKTDDMFMVRRKSMSKSPARKSWMFT